MIPIDKLTWMGECSGGLNRRQPKNAENGRNSVPVEEHTGGLSDIKWSALKIYTYMSHKHMETEEFVFMYLEVCVCVKQEKEEMNLKESDGRGCLRGFRKRKKKERN